MGRQRRLYSLFERRGFRYHRVSQWAYVKPKAVLYFQDALLAGGKSLRPVQDTWLDGQRIYRPPVELLDADGVRTAQIADNAIRMERSAPVVVKARSKSYRTGEQA